MRRFFSRFFRERDAAADQLHELERQGAGQARTAHFFGNLLIVLFSLASFVFLGKDALNNLIIGYQHGHLDVPAAISLLITLLFVPAMDSAMIYASSMLRLLSMRGANKDDGRIHQWVLIGVSLIESATYIGMSITFENPTNGFQVALIIGRALPAPLIANYLALARPLPVTHRDIMAQVEHAASVGILRDAFRMANDPNRSLADKVALYLSAVRAIPQEDRAQLQAMIDTLTAQEARRAAPVQTVEASEPPRALPEPTKPSVTSDAASPGAARPQGIRSNENERRPRSDSRPRRRRDQRPKRADAGMTADDRAQLQAAREEAAQSIIAQFIRDGRELSVRVLAHDIAVATRHTCSTSKANDLMQTYRPLIEAKIRRERAAQAEQAENGDHADEIEAEVTA